MQGNAPALLSRELSHAIECCSKSLLMDLVVDMVRRTLGEEATDEQVVELLVEYLGPVCRVRNQRPPNLDLAYARALERAAKACDPNVLRMPTVRLRREEPSS